MQGEGNLQTPKNGHKFTTADFDAFWTAYPRKVGKAAARRKYETAVKSGVTPDLIAAGLKRYKALIRAAGTETQYIAHPATWLNQGRWDDEESDPNHDGYKPLVIPKEYRCQNTSEP